MSQHFGEYGGRVLRGFTGKNKKYIPEAILTPEEVADWPLSNRRALFNDHKVEWFGPPREEETAARKAGSPAPDRRTLKNTEKPEKQEKENKPATSSRRRSR